MAQVEFRGSATSVAFDPLRAPDQTPQMREQLRDTVGAVRENNESVIRNRNQIAAGMAERDRATAQGRERNLTELSQFSKTISDMVLKEAGRRNDQAWDEGFNQYYAGGGDPKALEEFDQGIQQLSEADQAVNRVAYKAAQAGEPDEAVSAIRRLSGAKRVGYLTALAQDKGSGYEAWLQDLINSDDQTQIQLGDRTVTPKDALKDRATLAGVATWARTQYIRRNGLNEASMPLLARYVMPQMRAAESKIVGSVSQQIRLADAEKERDETVSVLMSNIKVPGQVGQSFNNAVTRLQSVINPETGQLYTTGGATRYLVQQLQDIASDGADSGLTIESFRELLDASDLDGSNTWGKRFPTVFNGLIDAFRSGVQADNSRLEAEESQQEKEWVTSIMQYADSNGGLSDAMVSQAREAHQRMFRGRPFPDSLASRRTIEQKSAEVSEDYFQQMLVAGRIPSPGDWDGVPPEIVLKYRPLFEKLQQEIIESPNAKSDLESLEAALLQSLEVTDINAPKNFTLPLAQAELRRQYTEAFNRYVVGSNPQAARQQAYKEVLEEIQSGRTQSNGGKGTGRYLVDPNKEQGFIRLIPGGMTAQQQVAAKNQLAFADQVATGGTGAVTRNAQRLAPKEVLDEIEKLKLDPKGARPVIVTYLTQALNRRGKNVSEWDVMDLLLTANQRNPIPRPGSVQAIQQNMDPKWQQLLNSTPSPRRTQRAFASMQWNAAKVPNGWGTLIEQEAKANGIEPSLLAGLLQAESSWNPRARSRSGAMGIAQFMPDTARGVGLRNPDDPREAIPAAARYLRQKIDDFGGDVRLGLRAYNQGTAGTQRNPNGRTSEAREYPDKVLRYASTFGWGQTAQPFTNPQLMNPRLARAASRTFDRGQPGIDLWFENKQFPAVLPGRVKEIGYQGRGRGSSGQGYGNFIVVESVDPASGQPVDVLYAHLDSINVQEGQRLREGQVLGKQGGTGRVISEDGTIASIDFLAPAQRGSGSMTPFANFQRLRQDISRRWYGS